MPAYPHVTLACFDCKVAGSVLPASRHRGPCFDSDETNLDQTQAMEKYETIYGLICPSTKTNKVKIWSNKVKIWSNRVKMKYK